MAVIAHGGEQALVAAPVAAVQPPRSGVARRSSASWVQFWGRTLASWRTALPGCAAHRRALILRHH